MSLNPLPLLSSGLTAAGSFLGGIQTYLIVGAITAALAGAGGAYAGYRWEAGQVTKLQLADAQALTSAVQAKAASDARQAGVNLSAALDEQKFQDALTAGVVVTEGKVPAYVTPLQDRRACLSVGLMHILRAAATGADPATLQLAPGQSDDDCSDAAPSEVASWFTAYAGASRGNAEQLNALEAWITANHLAQ